MTTFTRRYCRSKIRPLPLSRSPDAIVRRAFVPLILLSFGVLSVGAATLHAQVTPQGKHHKNHKQANEDSTGWALPAPDSAPLFDAEGPLQLTLTGALKQLRRDRGDHPPWRAASLAYTDDSGHAVTVPVRARTRGIWRLHNCDFPPLRLDFAKGERKHTLFARLDRPKLVTHCHDSDRYEEYLLEELQLYRVYNLLTPMSHHVRLAKIAYRDSASGKTIATRYAIVEEEPAAVARRVGALLLEQKGAGPDDLDPLGSELFALFQFLIGNTDWSISALHNVELVEKDTSVFPLPYDFDFSGVISTPDAVPDPRLGIARVRTRLFRGYCVSDPSAYARAYALFDARKNAIYALYHDSIGTRLDRGRVKQTLEYFDEFYEIINDPRRAHSEIEDRCLGGR